MSEMSDKWDGDEDEAQKPYKNQKMNQDKINKLKQKYQYLEEEKKKMEEMKMGKGSIPDWTDIEFSLQKIELNDGDILVLSIPPHWSAEKHNRLATALDNTFKHHGFDQRNITWVILSNEIKLGVIKSGDVLADKNLHSEPIEELRLIRVGEEDG